MWSGPRNISTALMRAWETRPDAWVSDEPLYGHYLTQVRVNHPGVEEVVAAMDTDWRRVVAAITGPIPAGRTVWYQKHMAHHYLPHLRGDWVLQLSNCFLIRHPADMLLSLDAKMGTPVLADTGLPQQLEIFQLVRERTGSLPPVIDAEDVLRDPGGMLARLCSAVGVDFSPGMLAWAPGPRPTDGVWGKHWYDAVWRSTGFEPYRARPRTLSPALEPLLAECTPYYEALAQYRLLAT